MLSVSDRRFKGKRALKGGACDYAVSVECRRRSSKHHFKFQQLYFSPQNVYANGQIRPNATLGGA